MLPAYTDITRRLGEPLWYDEHGVPRYDPFQPDLCGIYGDFVAFLEIACQACARRFRVSCGISTGWYMIAHEGKPPTLPVVEDSGSFGYGDPPRHDRDDGRCAGETMGCHLLRVREFWRRDGPSMRWCRDVEHEVNLWDPWDPAQAHGANL